MFWTFLSKKLLSYFQCDSEPALHFYVTWLRFLGNILVQTRNSLGGFLFRSLRKCLYFVFPPPQTRLSRLQRISSFGILNESNSLPVISIRCIYCCLDCTKIILQYRTVRWHQSVLQSRNNIWKESHFFIFSGNPLGSTLNIFSTFWQKRSKKFGPSFYSIII